MKIIQVENESIAQDLGIQPGDELTEINGERVRDILDYRFHENDEEISLTVVRNGEATIFDIEQNDGDRLGLEFDEMKILSCGNDCIFCFVDQNPAGLRQQLYFRDGDYRLSFMYGNYTTMTNAGPAILRRIVDQRLSPQYISVHVTDYAVRKKLMGLKKDDHILEKIKFLHENGIAMHTQIVLCPGLNDGDALAKTVSDLYSFNKHIVSLAIVPVGLTDHRFGLEQLSRVDQAYATRLLEQVNAWQKRFRKEIGRGFVYASDEFHIVAGAKLPATRSYDGFPQIENGVGMVRSFLNDFAKASKTFPKSLPRPGRMTIITAVLAEEIMRKHVLPVLNAIGKLEVNLIVAKNTLFGESVTVSGLLSGNCVYSALQGHPRGHLVLLPPDILNSDGRLLDNLRLSDIEDRIGTPVMSFDGDWKQVFLTLKSHLRK
jgi:putative radical SAM enzyme (TIGR03279 family)